MRLRTGVGKSLKAKICIELLPGNLLDGADDRLGVLYADQLVRRAAGRVGAELHRGGALHREQVRGHLPRVGRGTGRGTGGGGDLQRWNNCRAEVLNMYQSLYIRI